MITTLPLTSIPLSPLVQTAVHEQTITHIERAHVAVSQRLQTGIPRPRLQELLRQSLHTVTLSDAQEQNLAVLRENTSGIAICGQQVGPLGGPLYTVLKIASTVQAARDLTEKLHSPVVPVFWLEDNDHDAEEASTTWLARPDGTAERQRHWDGSDPRKRVGDRTLSAHDVQVISAMIDAVDGKFADQERTRLQAAYVEGRSWAEAFLDILHPFLSAWGVLVVRASQVIASGMHGPLIERLLEQHEAVHQALTSSTERLLHQGFQAQATIPPVPLFELDTTGRQRVSDPESALLRARSHPERFTPHALSRPLMQDALLPTLATILGPGEIAYHAQLHDLYALMGVSRPAVLLRHMAVLIDPRAQRHLQHLTQPVSWFFRAWHDVEADVTAQLTTGHLPELPDVPALLASWRSAAASIDPTLLGSVGAAEKSVQSAMEALAGKFRGALRKQQSITLDRYRAVWWSVYPHGTPSDRMYPLAHWIGRLGIETLIEELPKIAAQPRDQITVWSAA